MFRTFVCFSFKADVFQKAMASMASRRRIKYSDRWLADGRTETEKSISYNAIFSRVHYYVILILLAKKL